MYSIIANPLSGGGLASQKLPELEKLLRGKGIAYRMDITRKAGEARTLARKAAVDGLEGVIAMGGDGTFYEVANGLGESGLELIFAPCGTGNDFIKMFGEQKERFFDLAELVRGEVRQIRHSEYILASRCMGGSFGWIMRRHLVPNVVSAILFVVISAISTSIAMESTLSFLGLGLPVDELSWGSMLALADKALLLNTWWVILIPGLFLVTALLCITSLGHHFRRNSVRGPSNL